MRKRSEPSSLRETRSGSATTRAGRMRLSGSPPRQRVSVMPPGKTRFGFFELVPYATAEPRTAPIAFRVPDALASFCDRPTRPPASLMRFSSCLSPALWSRVSSVARRLLLLLFGAAFSCCEEERGLVPSVEAAPSTARLSPTQATSSVRRSTTATTAVDASGHRPSLAALLSVSASTAARTARRSRSFGGPFLVFGALLLLSRSFALTRADAKVEARPPPQPSKTPHDTTGLSSASPSATQ
mmetsp:Transcript_22375/g.88833  ORF Transcript_22375/g.88833 Transcript_22375/m.88833 type:complete len:242 (+) Transcript_22375:452-1177(+)